MKTLMNLLMTCAIVGMMSATAMAGGDGGGAKDDGTILVKNNSATHIMLVNVGPQPTSITAALAAGAKFIAPSGGTAKFSAAAGNHNVSALFVHNVTAAPLPVQNLGVTVVKNATKSVTGTTPGGVATLTSP